MDVEQDNYGYGFYGFKARLEAAAQAFGGAVNARKAVSEAFQTALRNQQMLRRPKGDYSHFDWTQATDQDFDYAAFMTLKRWKHQPEEPLLTSVEWNGLTLEAYEHSIYLRGDDLRVMVAMTARHDTFSWRQNGNVEQWNIFMTDEGCTFASGDRYASGDQKSTNAKSPSAASASLRRMVEKHFKVTFPKLAKAA